MPANKVNYDEVAPTYNERYRVSKMEGSEAGLRDLVGQLHPERILEVGCGTAHWIGLLSKEVDLAAGLDFSPGMLAQADRSLPTLLACGTAVYLPYPDHCFDLVFSVNALHHFPDQPAFIREAYRVLKPGGAFTSIGMDPHRGVDRWYVYDYFPHTREIDWKRFPSGGKVLDWLEQTGFVRAEWKLVDDILSHRQGEEVFEDPFIKKDSTSQLTLLTDEEYEQGLANIRSAIKDARLRGQEAIFEEDLKLTMITGFKA